MVGMYLSGDFEHTLDPKGRVTLPVRYRDHFKGGVRLVRFPSREPCISVFHPDAWEAYDQKFMENLNDFDSEEDSWSIRETYSSQAISELDRAGRILLNRKDIDELGLSGKVKILGARDRLEIWDPDTYQKERKLAMERRLAAKQKKREAESA
jgi:MraZ protein